jgi:hypothetical protein
MGFQGSNFEPGIAPESGSIAGPGSYVGVNTDGELILTTAGGGGGGTPGGADNQIQFNNGGSFAGAAGLTWDDTNLAATRAIFGTTAATLTVAAGELSTLSAMDSGSNKYTTQYDAVGKLQGHVLSLGGSTTETGKIYYLTPAGNFAPAISNAVADGGSQFLAVALSTNSSTNGMLRKGTVRVTGSLVDDTIVIGAPVYVSKATPGGYQFATPSGSGEYVRQVGYCLDKSGIADMLLLLDPSDTFVEIA